MAGRAATLVAVIVSALIVVGVSQAAVRKVSFTATVQPGDEATLTVTVSPRARCTITVVYHTTVSHAKGLAAKTGSRLTSRWTVGTSTHAGRWPVVVNCGKSGTLRLKLHVL